MKVRLSQLNTLWGIIGGMFLTLFLFKQPIFLLYMGIMLLPGFLLTYLFSEEEFSFIERFALGLAISNIFLIILRALTTLTIPFGRMFMFIIILIAPIIIGLLKHKTILKDIRANFKNEKRDYSKIYYAVFVIALATFLVWFVWGSLLQGTKLPLTDQVVQFSWITANRNTVENFHRYPYWFSEYSGGFPFSIFEDSFYYQRISSNWMLMPSFNLVYHMNCYSFLNLVLVLLGTYCLARRLGWGKFTAILAMVFFICSPLLGSKLGYSGDMKEMTSFAIAPMMMVVFFLMMEKREISYYLLFGVLAASYYFTNLVPLIPTLMMIGFMFIVYKLCMDKPLNKLITKREILGIGALGIGFIFLIGLNLVPLVLSLKYGTTDTWNLNLDVKSFFEGIIKPLFSEPAQQYTHNLGLLFTLAAICGMITSLTKFRKNENYFLLAFWMMLLCYIIPVLKLPLNHVEVHRLLLMELMVLSLFVSYLFEAFKRPELKIGAIVIFIIILVMYTPLARTLANEWVNEQAQNGMFEQIYRQLDKLGPGRAINYGIFAYATEPLIPVESSSIWMITHTTGSGARTIPQYELKDGSESALNKEHNITYIINRMRTTFTRYIIVVKDPGRQGDVTYAVLRDYLPNSSMLHDSQQLAIFVVPDSYYIQSVILSKTEISREEIYSNAEGWRLFSFATQKDDREYGNVISSKEDISKLPYPVIYNFEIVSPGELNIYGNFTGEWIVVKDHYFPTWHAEMDGKELRIEESNLGTLLIKTEQGSKIRLFHRPYWYEPILAVVAISFIFGMFSLLMFTKRNKQD